MMRKRNFYKLTYNRMRENAKKHREAILQKIQDEVMGISIKFYCWDCLRKQGLVYPGNKKGISGKCYICGKEGEDFGLKFCDSKYPGEAGLGDILDWYEGRDMNIETRTHNINIVLSLYERKRLSIFNQTWDCIKYLHGLILIFKNKGGQNNDNNTPHILHNYQEN